MSIHSSGVRAAALLACLVFCALALPLAADAPRGSDLDDLMARVLVRRDENWRKLQQYVLDEREEARFSEPGGATLAGFVREYTWYIRDGVFVRSPVRFDGVALGEDERRRYEREWLERQRRREAREAERGRPDAPRERADEAHPPQPAGAIDILTKEPQFVSAAYFLKFKFEPGRYALVGREAVDGHEALRIEYYPARLFRDERGGEDRPDDAEDRFERQMNKVALITLWVDPVGDQILQYVFDNVGFDFLPGRSIVRVEDVRASMRMAQVFPDVWLPHRIDARVAITLATGTFDARYAITYRDYRQADVKARIR